MTKLIKLTEENDKKFPKDQVLASYVSACKGADLIIGANLTITITYVGSPGTELEFAL